jgi:hypothetical protein
MIVLLKNGQKIETPIVVDHCTWWIDVEFSKSNYNRKEVKNSWQLLLGWLKKNPFCFLKSFFFWHVTFNLQPLT